MATLVPDKQHPALDVDEPERVDYLTVVASMAYADHHADDSELARVKEMCEHLEIGEEGTTKVLAAARDPDRTALAAIVKRLESSALRFALLVDAIDIAYADEKIDPQETVEIEALADQLDISLAQVAMIHRYVASKRGLSGDDEVSKEILTGLVAAGVPLAALALATIAGIPAVGVGIGAALGVGSYFSVRWLARRIKRDEAASTEAAAPGEPAQPPSEAAPDDDDNTSGSDS